MKQTIGLKFPKGKADKPLLCQLVSEYDLVFNILQARVEPGQRGRMILELSGEPEAIKSGLEYAASQGLTVIPLPESVTILAEKCIECGACTAVCPSGALTLSADNKLLFQNEYCLLCGACETACPMRAIVTREELLDIE